jgi:hypothetical protein
MALNEIRSRKTSNTSASNKKRQKGSNNNKDKSTANQQVNGRRSSTTKATPAKDPETLWQTFQSHPLVNVAPYILIPYFLYKIMLMIVLRQPQIFTGLIELRPAVAMNETRQVLVLGAIGSGTRQVAEGLSKVMKLEIALEGTNSLEVCM